MEEDEKEKKKKRAWQIEVIGSPGDTKSEAAKKSMEMLQQKLAKLKEAEKKGKKYADLI